MVLFLDQILIHLPINQIHSYIIMKMETREQMNKKALSEKIPPLTPINLEIIKGRWCFLLFSLPIWFEPLDFFYFFCTLPVYSEGTIFGVSSLTFIRLFFTYQKN